MKCKKCNKETGSNWKTLCYECYKKQQQKQTDRNYLSAWKSGNIQNDLCFAEDNEGGD